ncbi:hypothetical protein B0H19DRAFT_1060108 [Mycena capillaripes]|nr:hypothetical protein B0H19DRAFT_1060108 [Mycena capillaripes]
MSASYLLAMLCLLGAFIANCGTPGDGPATTYVYQAMNPTVVRTTDANGFLTQTTSSPTSGWFEIFSDHTISCGFVDSMYGQCMDIGSSGTSVGNSGVPTPVILLINTPPTSPPSVPTPTRSPTEDQTSNQVAKKTPVAAIAVSASLVLLLRPILVLWWFRRRRLRKIAQDFHPHQYDAEAVVHTHTPKSQFFARASEKKALLDSQRASSGGEVPSSVPEVSSIPADISTSELAFAYYHRTQAENFDALPPPEYS